MADFNIELESCHCSSESGSSIPMNQKDRKSTRLNSSHGYISYAVFCLQKKQILPRVQKAGRQHETLAILQFPLLLDYLTHALTTCFDLLPLHAHQLIRKPCILQVGHRQ